MSKCSVDHSKVLQSDWGGFDIQWYAAIGTVSVQELDCHGVICMEDPVCKLLIGLIKADGSLDGSVR